MAQVDSAVVVKTFSLSQKEEKLKNKLFQIQPQQKQTIKKPPIAAPPQSGGIQSNRSRTSSQQNTQSKLLSDRSQTHQQGEHSRKSSQRDTSFQQAYDQIPDEKVDHFLKQMEEEFNNINKKQVSIGLLNSQTQIIKQQNEVLNENQKQLALLMSKIQGDGSISKQKNELVEENKQVLQSLLEPINAQIEEIKQIYEQTKKTQKELMNQKNEQQSPPDGVSIQDFLNQNGQLKSKLESASTNLMELLPGNLNVFDTMTNFNIDIYKRTIKALKVQIEDLQNEAQKAEIELEEREQKLNSLPKQDELLIPYQEVVQGFVDNIDFLSSHQIILNKLGGELEYDEFIDSVQDICVECEGLWREYKYTMEDHAIQIPKAILTQSEINDMTYNIPSILEEIKEKLGMNPSKPIKNPMLLQKQKYQKQEYINQAKQDPDPLTSYANTKNIKPKNLEEVRTDPKECQKEINYQSLEEPIKSSTYKTVLPPQSSETEKNKEEKIKISLINQKSISSLQALESPSKHKVNFFGKKKIEEDYDEESKGEDDEDNGQFVQLQLDPNVIQNLAAPFRKQPSKQFDKKIDDRVEIEFDQEGLSQFQFFQPPAQQQQQPMDKEQLKNIFMEFLNENKDQIFGMPSSIEEQNIIPNILSESNNLDQQENINININQKEEDRRKLSELPLKISKEVSIGFPQKLPPPFKQISQQFQHSNVGSPSHSVPINQQPSQQSIQAQSQDLALNFLNIINNTLAQISSAVSKPIQPPNSELPEVSEGSLQDDSMEAGIRDSRNPQQPHAGFDIMGYPQNIQPEIPYNYQQGFQQQNQMGMGNMPMPMAMPMPIYPNTMIPSAYVMPYQNQGIPNIRQRAQPQQYDPFNTDPKINLNDYYKEFQLSDTDTVHNQSVNLSQYDMNSNQSIGNSIFNSQDSSRSAGQVSVPIRNSYNKNNQQSYKPRDGKIMSDVELSSSHEMENKRRRQSQRQKSQPQRQQQKSIIGDDILSEMMSEGEV